MDQVESMLYVNKPAWHLKGVKINEEQAYDLEECLEYSGLNWDVRLKPCFILIDEDQLKPTSHKAVVRESDNKILGVVGKRFTPIQNRDAFQLFQPFLNFKLARIETAGSLCEGRRVWILLRVGDPIDVVPNDPVERFILLSHGHDGKSLVRLGFTPTRVVCANTLATAHSNVASKLIKLKHTKNVITNLEVLRDAMKVVDNEFVFTIEQYKYLTTQSLSSLEFDTYIKKVFCFDETPKARQQTLINRMVQHFESAPGSDLAPRTLWSAYNAVTYYLNHESNRTQDTRLMSLWFGNGHDLSERALDVAVSFKGD